MTTSKLIKKDCLYQKVDSCSTNTVDYLHAYTYWLLHAACSAHYNH